MRITSAWFLFLIRTGHALYWQMNQPHHLFHIICFPGNPRSHHQQLSQQPRQMDDFPGFLQAHSKRIKIITTYWSTNNIPSPPRPGDDGPRPVCCIGKVKRANEREAGPLDPLRVLACNISRPLHSMN